MACLQAGWESVAPLLFRPRIAELLAGTVALVVVTVPLCIGLGLATAWLVERTDLPGRRLIGAFLSTLGLPQINPVNEQFRARMQGLFGDGYAYTYLFPGLQKVVQAAGRVIRTTEDRGVVHLIDDRYASAEVQRLLPRWWQIAPASSIIALPQA